MNRKVHLPSLDLIRVSCMMVIVVYHYSVESYARNLSPFSILSSDLVQSAVYMMTLLSGFCLSLQEQHRKWSLGRYIKGRILAIFPLYWLCFFPIFIYSDVLCGNNSNLPRWKILLSLIGVDGYFQSVTPTFYKIGEWYLGCILFLYLLFPLLWILMRRGHSLLLGEIAGILLILEVSFLPQANLYPTVLGQLPLFIAGMLLGRRATILEQMPPWAFFSLGVILLCCTFQEGSFPIISILGFILLFRMGQFLLKRSDGVQSFFHWLARQCYGVFLIHHLAITLFILPVLERFPVSNLIWILMLALLLLGSFLGAALLNILMGRLTKFWRTLKKSSIQ